MDTPAVSTLEPTARALDDAMRCPEPTTLVIFGASGDLTRRMLVPALHDLACRGLWPEGSVIIGSARTEFDDASFRADLEEAINAHGRMTDEQCAVWDEMAERIHYVAGSYDEPETYRRLAERAAEHKDATGGNCILYLAVPPSLFGTIVGNLDGSPLLESDGYTRVIVEKPFGHDLESAEALNRTLHSTFDEGQIYRIDHYLGKETVQNIVVFRFGNAVLEPLWNRNYIDHVQITVAEAVDIGDRGGYYDQAGVVRDMFQNHLMQLLSLIAMEPPVQFGPTAVRNEKVKVLRAVRPLAPDEVGSATVRGQYVGYRDAEGVPDDSETATFAALRLEIENWRWSGVPFFLRSGKALEAKATEISVVFRDVPHLLFPATEDWPRRNSLTLCIQPHEGIHLRMEIKVPGEGLRTRSIPLDFHYDDIIVEGKPLPEAYERLLLDAMHGDATLFTRSDEIELAWSLIDPVMDGWNSRHAPPLERYADGTWGPDGQHALLGAERSWIVSCRPH